MAMRYHPDRYQTFTQKAWATRRFIEIRESYDFLLSIKWSAGKSPEEELSTNIVTTSTRSQSQFSSFFNRVLSKISPLLGGALSMILIIILPLIVPMFWIMIACAAVVHAIARLLAYCGFKSLSKGNKSIELVFITIIGCASLALFNWVYFSYSDAPTTILRILLWTFANIMAVLIMASEWTSFIFIKKRRKEFKSMFHADQQLKL